MSKGSGCGCGGVLLAIVGILALLVIIPQIFPPAARPPPTAPDWGVVAHFGLITTVWLAPRTLHDASAIAQILHAVEQRYGKGLVWFFDDASYTPRGVPMTDAQMRHWVGLYDPTQSETFSYIEVTNPNTSPPETRTIKTTIRPGYAE